MTSIGSELKELVGFGTSSSHEDQASVRFEELAMPLFDSLYNFARWIARDSDDAEDLAQETYLKALRSFSSFQPGTNFRAWMFRILRNTFLSSRKTFERRMIDTLESEEDGPELAVVTETPETILMDRFNIQRVQRAIDDLPSHYRETLLLCEVEEMSYQQIAEILSIPIGTVMSRLARARKAVRESVGGSIGASPQAEGTQTAGQLDRVRPSRLSAEKTNLCLTLGSEIEPGRAQG
jgi:RNA polymerase sigma factor (sigma-70 family)